MSKHREVENSNFLHGETDVENSNFLNLTY